MNIVRIFLLIVIMCVFTWSLGVGQILTENFGYSTGSLSTVGSPTWVVTDDDFSVVTGELSYSNYAPDNTSTNSLNISDDVTGRAKVLFSPITTGTLYCSFILNVSFGASTPLGPDNFILGFWETAEQINLISAAVYAIDIDGSTFSLGIARFAGSAVDYVSTPLTKGVDHLIVVKYTFVGSFSDDIASLYVDPTLPGSEPVSPDASSSELGEPDAANLSRLVVNQDGFDGVSAIIDAIRLGTTWDNAPLPVQLTNFTATSSRFGVDLQWSTATELNNYGFDIDRRKISRMSADARGFESENDAVSEWNTVGFVQGAGTSTSPREYSYTDANVEPGRYAYRIKQIDMNNAFTYYSAAEVEVGLGPKELTLEPNYPNPFNPSTNITFTVPVDGRAALKVYNMLGQEVATLFDEEAVAGRVYQKTFDASSLPTGVYVSRLEFGGQAIMRKMLFVK